MKDLKILFITTIISFLTIAKSVQAENEIDCPKSSPKDSTCWKCGDHCTAELNSSGKLIISGTGAMYNYGFHVATQGLGATWETSAPWYTKAKDITSAEVSGVTTLGDATFLGMKRLTSVDIADSVTSVGQWSLQDCNLSNIYLPDSVTNISTNNTFSSNPNLQNILVRNDVLFKIPGGQNLLDYSKFMKYEAKGDLVYLYDPEHNIKGVFTSQDELKAIINNIKDVYTRLEGDKYIIYDGNGGIKGIYNQDYTEQYNSKNQILAKYNLDGNIIEKYVYNSDGSVAIYNKDGKLIGLQGKRILTVDEASALVKNNKNTFKLKYR